VLADAEDRDDVGMVQPRDGLRLALETLEPLRVELGVVDRLDRDMTPERLLHRFIDDPHPPPAQLPQDPELADPLGQEAGLLRPPAQLLHHGDRPEQFADLLRLVGESGFILRDRWRFTAPSAINELLGQSVERVAVAADPILGLVISKRRGRGRVALAGGLSEVEFCPVTHLRFHPPSWKSRFPTRRPTIDRFTSRKRPELQIPDCGLQMRQ